MNKSCLSVLFLMMILRMTGFSQTITTHEIDSLGWVKLKIESKYIDSVAPQLSVYFITSKYIHSDYNHLCIRHYDNWINAGEALKYKLTDTVNLNYWELLLKLSIVDFLRRYSFEHRKTLPLFNKNNKYFDIDYLLKKIKVTKGDFSYTASKFTKETKYNFKIEFADINGTTITKYCYYDELTYKFRRHIWLINDTLMESPYYEETSFKINKSINIIVNAVPTFIEADNKKHYYRTACIVT